MSKQNILNKISQQMLIDIDNYCHKKWGDEPRSHLGASLIGDDCQRKLWYQFRWITISHPEPRLKRLFNRGHLEEDRFIDYLRGIGCIVNPFNTDKRLIIDNSKEEVTYAVIDKVELTENTIDVSDDNLHILRANEQGLTYPVQHQVSEVEGHFGGSCDGRGYLPEHYGINEEILFEFKTANEKSFNSLLKDGMQTNKPLHYAQCCTYGYLMKLNYVCYVCVCKNDDRIYLEIVPLNHKTGEMQILKADRIIKSKEPLPRLYENPTFWICKICDSFSVCHGEGKSEVNCRSCKHAEPAKGKLWVCNKHNCVIPKENMLGQYECWEGIV